jgi:hypothetical protein
VKKLAVDRLATASTAVQVVAPELEPEPWQLERHMTNMVVRVDRVPASFAPVRCESPSQAPAVFQVRGELNHIDVVGLLPWKALVDQVASHLSCASHLLPAQWLRIPPFLGPFAAQSNFSP